MDRLKRRFKDRRIQIIPFELQEALREVAEILEEARRNPDLYLLDCDDSIELRALVGGRYGRRPRTYEFVYQPDGGSERDCWFLALSRKEIEDIGEGRMTEIPMYCCTRGKCWCKFRVPFDIAPTVITSLGSGGRGIGSGRGGEAARARATIR